MTTPKQPEAPTTRTQLERGLSITQKLVALILLTSGAIVAVLTGYFLSQQLQASELALERKAATYGRLVSKEVASAIAFDDQETAREVFDSMAQDQDIESMLLLTASGSTLYAHGAPGAWISAARGGVSEQRVLHLPDKLAVVSPVVSAEGPRGTLVIELSTRALAENNRRLMRTALVVAALSLALGALFAFAIARSLGRRLGKIGAVASAVSEGDLSHAPVEVVGGDEIARLAHGFNIMLTHIQTLVQQIRTNAESEQARLESLVDARTHALNRRNADMRMVLDNVDQGFVGVDRKGKLSPERSARVDAWLGAPEEGETLFSWIDRNFAGKGDYFRVAWDGLSEDWMPLEMRLDQLPQELNTADRSLAFAYKPVMEGEELDKVLVVISDMTALRAKRRAEEEEQELGVVVRKLLADRAGFRDFVAEADELVSAIAAPNQSWQHMRHLHTLKGNAAIFGLSSLARICHDIESSVQERAGDVTEDEVQLLNGTWTRVKDKVVMLTESRRDAIEVLRSDYQQLVLAVDRSLPPPHVRALLDSWLLEPVDARLARLGEYARVLAERLNKKPIEVELDAGGVRLDPRAWTPFWQALVHVIRNALDHGLETAEERAAGHKSGPGRLTLRARLAHNEFQLDVEDNGRGIDWDQVARVARNRGLPHSTPEELREALWADGLSTRDHATDTSGRGVGLSAVKHVCAGTGATIRIRSEPGRGTCFSFSWKVDEARRPKRTASITPANDQLVDNGRTKQKYVESA